MKSFGDVNRVNVYPELSWIWTAELVAALMSGLLEEGFFSLCISGFVVSCLLLGTEIFGSLGMRPRIARAMLNLEKNTPCLCLVYCASFSNHLFVLV